jgi:hypothetical protein
LFFPVSSGSTYLFAFDILFKSEIAARGITLALTFPAAVICSAVARIPSAADGTGGELQGWITSSGDAVAGTAVETANTVYKASIEGTIKPSANGNLQVQFANEAASNRGVHIMQESCGVMLTIP